MQQPAPVKFIQFVGDVGLSDYTLHFNGGLVFITSTDDPYRPVFTPVLVEPSNWLEQVVADLWRIVRWEYGVKFESPKGQVLNKSLIGFKVTGKGIDLSDKWFIDTETGEEGYYLYDTNWEIEI